MQNQRTIRILIVDHRAIVASGIAAILGDYPEFQVVGKAGSGEEALRSIERFHPDVVTMDIELPDQLNGLELIQVLRHRSPQTRVLVLTNLLEEMTVRDSLQLGVTGYLLKNAAPHELAHALRSAYEGVPTLSPEVTQIVIHEVSAPSNHDRHLTTREHQVLNLIAQGLNNQEIAEELSVSLSTAQFHVSNILEKLGVHNRIEAAAFAIRHRLTR
jgi:NarL family two-component system response regulator LiaR